MERDMEIGSPIDNNSTSSEPVAVQNNPIGQMQDVMSTYQNMFSNVVAEILLLDQKDKLNAADKSKRDTLIRKRKNIEDMLQSLKTTPINTSELGGGKRRKVTNENKIEYTKYAPDYPSFEKGERKDVKSPLMFIQALKIALQSSHLPKSDWISVFLNRMGVTLAEEMMDAIKYYNETHEEEADFDKVCELFLHRKNPVQERYMQIFMRFKRYNNETICQLNNRFRHSMQMAGENGFKKYVHQLYLDQLAGHERSMVKDYRRHLKENNEKISVRTLMEKAESIADENHLIIPDNCKNHYKKGTEKTKDSKEKFKKFRPRIIFMPW